MIHTNFSNHFNISVLIALLVSLVTESAFSQTGNILYAVEKEGYKTSYLFGTIHMIPEENIFLSDTLLGALYQCDELVLEADVFNANPAELLKYGQLPNGGKLDTALTKADYALLDSALKAGMGAGLAVFKQFKPFMIDAMLMAGAVPKGTVPWEKVLTDNALNNEKTISYLETIEQQLSFFDSIPVRKQLEQTVAYLREEGGMEAEYQKLVTAYLAGDVERLHDFMTESIDDPRYLYFLLEKRNRSWVPKITEGMKTKRLFVAVGAGHLPGETGVLNLLKKQGFSVTPLF